ncbi:MAG: hypothetical protein NT157_02960 [Candidatus Micrarchaeota archaeon]|nr:hypothetical protein [Candidatus Micrarchaeota archaeon]
MKTYVLMATALLSALAIVLQLTHGIIGVQTGFGMTVDLVAVPVLLAFFMFGFNAAVEAAFIMALFITFASPETWIGASMKFAATLPMIIVPALYAISAKRGIDGAKVLAILLFSAVFSITVFALLGMAGSRVLTPSTDSMIAGVLPIIIVALLGIVLARLWSVYGKGTDQSVFSKPGPIAIVLVVALLVRGVAMVVSNLLFAGPLYFQISPSQVVDLVSSSPLPVVGNSWYLVIFVWNVLQGGLELLVAWLIAFRLGFAQKYGQWG